MKLTMFAGQTENDGSINPKTKTFIETCLKCALEKGWTIRVPYTQEVGRIVTALYDGLHKEKRKVPGEIIIHALDNDRGPMLKSLADRVTYHGDTTRHYRALATDADRVMYVGGPTFDQTSSGGDNVSPVAWAFGTIAEVNPTAKHFIASGFGGNTAEPRLYQLLAPRKESTAFIGERDPVIAAKQIMATMAVT